MTQPNKLVKSIQELEAEIQGLDNEITRLSNEITKLHNEKTRLNQQLATANVSIIDKDNKLKALAQKYQATHAKLQEAGKIIAKLKAKLEALMAPPNPYGYCVRIHEDGTFDIMSDDKRIRVNADPDLDKTKIKIGIRLLLNEIKNIIAVDPETENLGEEAKVLSLLNSEVARLRTRLDETVDLQIADHLKGQISEGDEVLINGHLIHARLPKTKEVEGLFLTEVPTETYKDIGGLDSVIDRVIQLIEWPYIYKKDFEERGLKPPKGILLYGPPGCGKTLLAKAVAHSLGRKVAELHGQDHAQSYFLCVKGPELLNKWVGETERFIRELFKRARELATQNLPVVIFLDEMDALLRTRGSGISSDMESTVVPQFTTEMDGVENIENIIVIGATNRQDRIDPAVIRPGRFDDKIEIPRPDRGGASQVFRIYMTKTLTLPLHPQYFDPANYEGDDYIPKDRHGRPRLKDGQVVKYPLKRDRNLVLEYLIDQTLERIFDPNKEENVMVELTYQGGRKDRLYFSDFISGAVIKAIVDKAIRLELAEFIRTGQKGLSKVHFLRAVEEELTGQTKLPSLQDPSEWASIFGKRERVVNVKDLTEERRTKQEKARSTEEVSVGQYL